MLALALIVTNAGRVAEYVQEDSKNGRREKMVGYLLGVWREYCWKIERQSPT